MFDKDKIIFVFKTCDEVSGDIDTTEIKRDVVDKYENMLLEQNNNQCFYSSNENTDLCSYSAGETCRVRNKNMSEKIVEIPQISMLCELFSI